MVNSQLKIFTPVGTAMIIVVMPKKAFTSALEPMVKKWCSQTLNDRMPMAAVAYTMVLLPKSGLPEKVGTTSENTPKAGRMTM
jgi:hypothetical protein